MKVRFAVPSWRRPYPVETLAYISSAWVYVDPREAQGYRKENPGARIEVCPRGVQGNLPRVRNHIMDQADDAGVDVLVILDDDLQGIFYWERGCKVLVPGGALEAWVRKYSLVARELGARQWGVNVNDDRQSYREQAPFSFVVYIGGPFQVFLRGNELRYDERLPLKEDYDMSLQQLNRYRRVFRINKAFYVCRQAEQPGGCATYRTMEKEREQLRALQAKWGSAIVRESAREQIVHRRKRQGYHINPLLEIPIRGI